MIQLSTADGSERTLFRHNKSRISFNSRIKEKESNCPQHNSKSLVKEIKRFNIPDEQTEFLTHAYSLL